MSNRLINEQSPYLLQHAHNPVDWYPWGDEAFQKAKAENKPLIVSIGYAACHWCHVMERESFENADTAAYMNDHFVCIKVDREEHPDVDALYMDAVQAISGSGGWPLNAFVTTDRIPFYGGTYYPPRPAYNRPSWLQILQRMNEIWVNQHEEVKAQSEQMIGYLRQVSKAAASEASVVTADDCSKMGEALLKMADKEWGGFGSAPKFPGTMAITFLLEHYRYTGNEEALQHALFSLDKMIEGGIYDQIGGGFARYSVDREWLAPHFEKMLYDNALLISALSDAYALVEKPLYRQVIEQTIDFINRELRTKEEGFYSALDADSEGVEGKFYTWTWEEWQQATNGGNSLAEAYFGITDAGNWEHTNILHQAMPLSEAAVMAGLSIEEATSQIEALKQNLIMLRTQRVRPITDDKSLLSWNALMNHALTKAGITLQEEKYLRQAADHMNWMLSAFRDDDNKLMHVWKNGQARIIAKLDDYAYLMQAMIALGAATGNHQWIIQAAQLCELSLHLFGEDGTPFLFLSASTQTDIPVRKSDVYDGATPSANAVMAQVLGLLGMLMERTDWAARAEEMLARMLQTTVRYTYSFGHWATLLQRQLAAPKTVVIAGKNALQTHSDLLRKAPPHAIVIQSENPSEKLPLTADKKSDGDSLIFVCTGTACLPPVSSSKDALRLL
jgi:uncharacterized protein YyaL (SSP411 family)